MTSQILFIISFHLVRRNVPEKDFVFLERKKISVDAHRVNV